MTSSLRELFEIEAQGVSALGDVDAALARVARERRRRRQITIAAVAAVAAVALVVRVSGLMTGASGSHPVTSPSPSKTAPTVAILPDPRPLTGAPLVNGADAVVRHDGANGRGLVAVAGDVQRTVVTNFRIYVYALSPDGRLLVWSGEGDILHVLDLTTGREAYAAPIRWSTGGPGQTPALEWSSDSRRLMMVVVHTVDFALDPPEELQVFDVDHVGRLTPVGGAITLPDPFVGTDPTGSTVAAQTASGAIVTRAVAGGSWRPSGSTSVTAEPPGFLPAPERDRWFAQGPLRWSPDLARVAWVPKPADELPLGWVSPGPRSPAADHARSTVGWVTVSSGRWTTFAVDGADASIVAWHGDDLLLQTFSTSSGTTDVVAVGADGSARVLVSYSGARDYQGGFVDLVSVAVDRLPTPAG